MFYLYNKITSLSTKSQGGNEKKDNKENVTNCLDDNIDKNKNYEECYKKDEDIFLLFEDTKFENSNSINKNVNPPIKLDKSEVDKIGNRNENKLKVNLNKQDKLGCESGKENGEESGEENGKENGKKDVMNFDDDGDNFFKINHNNFCNFEFSNYNDNNHEGSKEKLENSFPKFESNSSIDWSNINLKNNTKRYLSKNMEDEFQSFNFENEDFDDYRTKDNEEVPSECNIKNEKIFKENENIFKESENIFKESENIFKESENIFKESEKIFKENSDFFFPETAWNKCINDDEKVNERIEINVSIKGKNSDEINSNILKKNELYESSFNLMGFNDMAYKKVEKEIKEDPFIFKCESLYNDENNISEEIVKYYKNKENSFNENIMHNDMHSDLIKNSEIVDNANIPNNNNDNDLPNFENEMKIKNNTEHIENNYCEQNDVEQNTIAEHFQENKNITPKKIHEIEEVKVNCSEREDVNKCVMEECAEYNDKNKCNSFDNFFYENQINEAEEAKEKGNIESFLFEKNMSFIDDEYEEICECGTSGDENISTNLLIKNNDNIIQDSLKKEEEDKNKIMFFEKEKMCEDNELVNNISRVNTLIDGKIIEINNNSDEGKNVEVLEENELWGDNTFIKETKCDSISENNIKEYESDSILNGNNELFEKEDDENIFCDKEKLYENELWNEDKEIKFCECKNSSLGIVIMNSEEEEEMAENEEEEMAENEEEEMAENEEEEMAENEEVKMAEKEEKEETAEKEEKEEMAEKEEKKDEIAENILCENTLCENTLCENNELFENKMLWGEKKIMKRLTREESIGIFTANQDEENIILKNKEIEIEKCSEKNEVKIDIENESLQISLENKKNSEINEDQNNFSSPIEFHEIKKNNKSDNSKFDQISKENIYSKNNNLTSVNLSRFTYEKINEIKANNRKEKKSDSSDNDKKSDPSDNDKKSDTYNISCNNMRNKNKLCNLKFDKINELEENLSKERKEIINYCQDIDKISSENNNFIHENEIKIDLNNNDNKKCNIISKKETKLKKKKKRNDDVENNIDGKLGSITNKFEYESNSLNFLKALKGLPNLEFLKCKDLTPFLRYFNIVLKKVTICFNNECFFYVLAGDETGCAYVKLRNEFRDLFKGHESFIIENCSVMEEGFHIILEMNKYSNIYPLKYNTIKNINKHINFSDAKFVSLSEHII